jgi:hypothetical protein
MVRIRFPPAESPLRTGALRLVEHQDRRRRHPASARCWQLECLRAPRGLLPKQALPRSGGSSGPTREVNFQQEAIDFTGPKTIADLRSDPFGSSQRFFCGVRPRGAAASRRRHGVELPIALFDAASPFVPGNRGADMVRAGALA